MLAALKADLDPLGKLWDTAAEWLAHSKTWYEGPLATVNAEEAERTAGDLLMLMTKLCRVLEKAGPERQYVARYSPCCCGCCCACSRCCCCFSCDSRRTNL